MKALKLYLAFFVLLLLLPYVFYKAQIGMTVLPPLAVATQLETIRVSNVTTTTVTTTSSVDQCKKRWKAFSSRAQSMESPWSIDWSPDFTYCGALFTLLTSCVRDVSVYGPEPLPNYYINLKASSSEMRSRYRRANIGFVHLPKAGGTSIESLLGKHLPNLQKRYAISRCQTFSQQAALNLLPSSYGSAGLLPLLESAIDFVVKEKTDSVKDEVFVQKLYTSKRNFGMHKFVRKTENFMYIVWFREPVSKVISSYHYNRSPKGSRGCVGHIRAKPLTSQSKTLTEFVNHPLIRQTPRYNNHYVRLLMFGEFPEIDSQFDDVPISMVSFDHKLPNVTEDMYLTAKQNLINKIAFVGILEETDLSQQMLCSMLSVKCPASPVWQNANKHEESIRDEDRKVLEELNYWDIKLYKDALELFEKQKKAFRDSED